MSYADWKARLTQGNAFDDADVARCYAHRPPYAPALYKCVLELTPRRDQLIDLGCGPGKVAAELAPHFTHTLALDPAAAMIDEARRLHPAPNITWLHAGAENAALPDRIDLVTAGTSIHWMQHDVLFPRLADRGAVLAVVTVEAPSDPRWSTAYNTLMADWLSRIGQTYDPVNFHKKNHVYEDWLDIAGRQAFTAPFAQTVDGFIEGLRSTATFSRARMGADLAAEFARDMRAALTPHARDSQLTFDTISTLVWGVPRSTPR